MLDSKQKMDIKLNSSARALLAQGISSDLVQVLLSSGYRLIKLRSMQKEELIRLGLTEDAAIAIHSKRPPIPPATLRKLLVSNKWVCCVCRDVERPITIHHIVAWSQSRSHDESNLAVLCRFHHDEAHTVSSIRMTLSPNRLREFKEEWERLTKIDDSVVVRKAVQTVGEHWYYFNPVRLYEIAESIGFNLKKLRSYPEAKSRRVLCSDNQIRFDDIELDCAYLGRDMRTKYAFMRELFEKLCESMSVENVSDRLDRSDLGSTLQTGDMIYVQGAYRFKRLNSRDCGPGQSVRGSRTANSVRIEFVFDSWYATSVSAHSLHLCGRSSAGAFLRITDIDRENGKLVIRCSVLAICAEIPNLKTRWYESPTFGLMITRKEQSEWGKTDDYDDESF